MLSKILQIREHLEKCKKYPITLLCGLIGLKLGRLEYPGWWFRNSCLAQQAILVWIFSLVFKSLSQHTDTVPAPVFVVSVNISNEEVFKGLTVQSSCSDSFEGLCDKSLTLLSRLHCIQTLGTVLKLHLKWWHHVNAFTLTAIKCCFMTNCAIWPVEMHAQKAKRTIYLDFHLNSIHTD